MVTGSSGFSVVRFFLGVAEAGFFPGIILYFTYWFPSYHHARIVSGFLIGLPIAVAGLAIGQTEMLGLFQDGLAGQTAESGAVMMGADRAKTAIAIHYVGVRHRFLPACFNTRVPVKGGGYACSIESCRLGEVLGSVESIVMAAGIRRRLTSVESPPNIESGDQCRGRRPGRIA